MSKVEDIETDISIIEAVDETEVVAREADEGAQAPDMGVAEDRRCETPPYQDTPVVVPEAVATTAAEAVSVGASTAVAFQPSGYLADATKKFLTDNRVGIFSSLLFFLLGFKFMFGPLALASLLIWAVVICVLTKVHRLSARYEATASADGVQIKRIHSLGHEILKLQWKDVKNIDHVESRDGNRTRITLNGQPLSFIDKIIFDDLFDYDRSILIQTAKQGSPSADTEIDAGRMPALPGLNFCPAEKFSTRRELIEDESSGQTKVPFLGETNYELIQYSPFGYQQKVFSKFLKKAEKTLMMPLFLLLAVALVLAGAKHLIGFLTVGIFIPLLFVILVMRQKTALFFNMEGIRLLWHPEGASQLSKLIPWDAVEYVTQSTEFTRGKDPEEKKRIDFRINSSRPESKHVKILAYLSKNLIKQKEGSSCLSLDLSALPDNKSKQNLLAAIARFVPADRVDPSVAETLNPTDPASYTKLWMDSLSSNSTSERRFEGALAAGQQLRNGKFEILEFLGAGGQASVYLAKDGEQQVVLKEFILPSHAGADRSVRSMEHIEKELEMMKKLQHENVVEYHDIFVEDHRCYLVLEHVEGKSLRALVEESGALPEKQVLDLALQMSKILQHLHGQSTPIVHRDFTPENLILDKNGVLKVIDFNLAQQLEEAGTRTIVGKHSYLPPEQFRGKASPQSDIYAMGASLYFLLTGQEPEPLTCSHPLMQNDSLSSSIDALVASATELELEDRFKNAAEIEAQIKELLA